VKLLRRRSDARVKAARVAHAAGDFVTARELAAEVVADGDRTLETLRGLAPDVAETVGLHAVAAAEGVFAAGARAEVRYGRADSVRLGSVTVEAVPVAVVQLDRPVLGTGFLRQFLATIDYPHGRLVLRPRAGGGVEGRVEVPFALAAIHLILARGSLDERGPLTFLVDSGLEDEGGASCAVPGRPSTRLGFRDLT
jgi:hypothetical protein